MLLAQITSKQLAEWRAYYALDPWGDWREDRRTALLGAIVAGANGKKLELDDLMLYDPMAAQRRKAKEKAKVLQLRKWLDGKAAKG